MRLWGEDEKLNFSSQRQHEMHKEPRSQRAALFKKKPKTRHKRFHNSYVNKGRKSLSCWCTFLPEDELRQRNTTH
jgi:hypothetical protein